MLVPTFCAADDGYEQQCGWYMHELIISKFLWNTPWLHAHTNWPIRTNRGANTANTSNIYQNILCRFLPVDRNDKAEFFPSVATFGCWCFWYFNYSIWLWKCVHSSKETCCSARRKERKIIGFSVEIFNAFSIEQRKNLLVNGFFDYCSNWW